MKQLKFKIALKPGKNRVCVGQEDFSDGGGETGAGLTDKHFRLHK